MTALLGLILLAALLLIAHRSASGLRRQAALTGWALAGLFLFLGLFNARKKLAMIPLGSAHFWLRLHVTGGMTALLLFWLHTHSLWPAGFYEQCLAGLFYALTLSGIAGYILQRIYPTRLTMSGVEMIYERIPAEIARLRAQAEDIIVKCTQESSSQVLAKHYFETLEWFFRRPRFFISHAAGIPKAEHWVRHQHHIVTRYLSDRDKDYFRQLEELARYKNKVDLHFALQSIMKGWLLIHIPLTFMALILSFWHVVLVHIYAL